MTAQLASMHDFIEKLMREVPRDIHPSAQQIIHEYYYEMRDAVDDPVEVWRLAKLIRNKVVLELGFLAEDAETFGVCRASIKLRRQAERFAARYGLSVQMDWPVGELGAMTAVHEAQYG